MANIETSVLKKSKRSISEVFLHCSATPEGREVTADTIRDWHKAKGWRDIGYHYVVRLDGTVEEGRSIHIDGAHARGHNQDSIGICIIGGVDKDLSPKDTRTEPQLYALHNLLFNLKNMYPNAKVRGHNEVSNKACPSFDVQVEYKYINTKTEKPMVDDFEMEGDFADFIDELTEDKANEGACSIDNPDCEGCGS